MSSMTVDDFRRHCDCLVHFAPAEHVRMDHGLLAAAQLLDLNADQNGQVLVRFAAEPRFSSYDKEYWKSRSRFKRKAGEAGSNKLEIAAGCDAIRLRESIHVIRSLLLALPQFFASFRYSSG